MFKRLFKTKTFWAVTAVLVTAAERVATGNATIMEGLQLVVPSVLALFVRDGVEKQSLKVQGS